MTARIPTDRPFEIDRDTLHDDAELAEMHALEVWQRKLDADDAKVRERLAARRRAIKEGARER